MTEFDINERVREIRTALDISQEAFGRPLGLSRSEIKNLEYKKTTLKEITIPLMCSVYHVNETWLRTGEGEMFIELTRDEQIAAFVGSALKDEDESIQQRCLAALASLTVEEWEVIAKLAKKMAGI